MPGVSQNIASHTSPAARNSTLLFSTFSVSWTSKKKNQKQSWLPAFWGKKSRTHKRLKERFLIGWNRTKRANFWGSPLFQATYNITTERKTTTINSTYLVSVRCSEAGGRKRARDWLSCVWDLFSERWQSTPFQIFFPHGSTLSPWCWLWWRCKRWIRTRPGGLVYTNQARVLYSVCVWPDVWKTWFGLTTVVSLTLTSLTWVRRSFRGLTSLWRSGSLRVLFNV